VYADHTMHMAENWAPWLTSTPRARLAWLQREIEMYAEARHIFTMSKPAATSLRTFYGVPDERITVVGGGVNFDSLPQRLLPANGHGPVILFVGREYLRKGGDVLLAAFKLVRERIPEARLRIMGTSEPSGEPGVEVCGLVRDRRKIDDAYRQAA